ncbi:pyruvate kinase [Fimbriimonas ginsengisoli]|uniref:Pyruvate kinase n=1 Tax=Fimbriimonas ginsengisoli Gsoil 348 TaxID=661478 RepID=A0A068NSN6_FIMGI|nr:pyruvate kinase [Fimbriimonas ginsengisoli]AIE84609.1 pyruvate kinase [Fimbriimonas ginsengisoli Gsoil 348]
MKRRTKIVCTLGPAVDSRDKIHALIEAGMNVARINCSHGDWDTRRRWIGWLRELSPDIAPVAILADLQGPKFRVGMLPGDTLELVNNSTVRVGSGEGVEIPIEQAEILRAMTPGGRLLLGDGEIELRVVVGVTPTVFEAKVVCGGTLRSRKGVTLVGKAFDVPALTPKDVIDAEEAVKAGVDFVALSYVKSAADARELRRLLERLGSRAGICAKIEMRQGIQDLDNILKVVDLVMVARGDMGLQMEIEDVPLMQKRIIQDCTLAGTPVITATQMLESMIHAPRPTRAEATDVANAILDGTDAVMLSGETASGSYPVECVRTMARIAEKAEGLYDRTKIEREYERHRDAVGHTDAIAHAVSDLAQILRPRAIVCTTTSGQTPRLVSKFRPRVPILCATASESTLHQMAVVWGVEAARIPSPASTDETIRDAIDEFFRRKRLKIGDEIIVTAGVPAGVPGNTNMILTQTVR